MSQTPAGLMFVKVSENIHDPQRMNPEDVCDLWLFIWSHQLVKLRLFKYSTCYFWKTFFIEWNPVFLMIEQPFLSFSSSVSIQSARLRLSLCVFSTEPVRCLRRSISQLHEHRAPLAAPVPQYHSHAHSQFDSESGSSRYCCSTGGCRLSHSSML